MLFDSGLSSVSLSQALKIWRVRRRPRVRVLCVLPLSTSRVCVSSSSARPCETAYRTAVRAVLSAVCHSLRLASNGNALLQI